MSLLHHISFDGPLAPRETAQTADSASTKPLRKAKSQSILSNPILRLVRNPVSTLETAVGAIWPPANLSPDSSSDVHAQSRRQILIYRMKDATDLHTWKEAAEELDNLEGNNKWKQAPESPLYDYGILQTRLQELEDARISRDPSRMLWLFRNYLTRSICNLGDLQLYKYSHIGTKYLIEDYIANVCDTLECFLDCYDRGKTKLDSRHVYEELLRTRQYFGRSALLLSGGGTFGMTHSGVIKTLWENNLLPRIISGSSAGSIIASVVCARTDEELPAALEAFCTGDLEVFERENETTFVRKMVRILTTQTVFDVQHLIRVMKGHLGDITFAEAYNRTRRILNISVSSTSMHELPRLMNYITAPNVLIWSAVVASCSVPLVFSPSTIVEKDPFTGEQRKWNPSQQYMDGSVDNDLPMTRLSEMFNVNHFIVSQVNPHVVPFLSNSEVISGPEGIQSSEQVIAENLGIWSTVSGIAKSEVLHRIHQLSELGIFPTTLTKIRSVVSQKYSGDITIVPEIPLSMVPRVLRNPDPQFMERALLCGERATWPKLSRIQNHLAIELAIDKAIAHMSTKIAFSPSQVNLRMLSLDRRRSSAASKHDPRGYGLRHRSRTKTKSWCAPQTGDRVPPLSQPSPSVGFRLKPNTSLEQKLRASIVNVELSSDSGITSDDDEDAGGIFLDLSSRRKRAHQDSSTERRIPAIEIYDSATSANLRSRSPSPADDSPDPMASSEIRPWVVTEPSTPYLFKNRRKSSPADMISPPIPLALTKSMPDDSIEIDRRERKLTASNSKADLSGTRGMVMRKKASR